MGPLRGARHTVVAALRRRQPPYGSDDAKAVHVGKGAGGSTLSGSMTCSVPEESRANLRSRKIAGAAVNEREMTSPVVALEAEG
jgi:hypothetical protein